MAHIAMRYEKYGPDKVCLIKSWYKDLTEETVKLADLGPAAYIHVDCDLYISAYQALDFMFNNKLIMSGTLIRYDDWDSVPEWQAGESLAHKQIFDKYSATAERVRSNIFIVT